MNSFPSKSRNIRWEDHHSCPMLDLRAETGVSLSCVDAMSVAVQMGRLDSIAITLGVLAVLLVIAGIFSYINFERIARSTAEAEANRVTKQTVERTAGSEIARQLRELMNSNQEFKNFSAEEAEKFSRSQEPGP